MKTRIFIFLLSLLFSCQNGSDDHPYASCRYGAPDPVFNASLPEITTHQFELKGDSAEETIAFEDGLSLRILQSGCDYIRQEYHFMIQQEILETDPDFWVSLLGSLLGHLGSFGPEYLAYVSWADAIEAKRGEIRLGAKMELQPGYFIQIDHRATDGHTIVMLTLSQEP